MVAAVTFDTFKFIETLESAGVPEQQAKAQLKAVSAAISASAHALGNDHDQELRQLEATIEAKTGQMETNLHAKMDKLDAKIDRVETNLNAKIDKVEIGLNGKFVLIQWMLGFLLTGVFAIVIKTFFSFSHLAG